MKFSLNDFKCRRSRGKNFFFFFFPIFPAKSFKNPFVKNYRLDNPLTLLLKKKKSYKGERGVSEVNASNICTKNPLKSQFLKKKKTFFWLKMVFCEWMHRSQILSNYTPTQHKPSTLSFFSRFWRTRFFFKLKTNNFGLKKFTPPPPIILKVTLESELRGYLTHDPIPHTTTTYGIF